MQLVQEIRGGFAAMLNGAWPLLNIDPLYPAYVIRMDEGFGVALEIGADVKIAEHFQRCRFHTATLDINGSVGNYLMLTSAFEKYRYEFAAVCAEFVDPGDLGSYRNEILQDPVAWWTKWTEMMGNATRHENACALIAEMLVLDNRFKADPTTEWTTSNVGTHDIECATESCEVKSTIKRYGAELIISSQHQLLHSKPLYLYFCRMEASQLGISINDIKGMLVADGYDPGKIEEEIEGRGFENGSTIRNARYKILETRKYFVDDSFPQITSRSFVGNKYPDGVTKIEYTVDLDNVKYTPW